MSGMGDKILGEVFEGGVHFSGETEMCYNVKAMTSPK